MTLTITLFSADDGNGNVELWSTDGTTGRTIRLADINPGAAGSNPANTGSSFDPDHTPAFAVLNWRRLFQRRRRHPPDGELWRSDGTAAGLRWRSPICFRRQHGRRAQRLFAEQHHGRQQSAVLHRQRPQRLRRLFQHRRGRLDADLPWPPGRRHQRFRLRRQFHLLVRRDRPQRQRGLYATNGGAITKVTSDHNTTGFIDVNGTGYLIATGVGGNALTRVVGTTPTAVSGAPTSIAHYLNANGVLYFTSLSHNGTLYSTNPSITTTTTVKTGLDFNFVNNAAFSMAALGTNLVFTSTDATHGIELWFSDGTSGGTVFLKDILPGTSTQFLNNQPANLTTDGNTVFFQDGDGKGGNDLWKKARRHQRRHGVLVKHIESANIGGNGVQMAENLTNMSAQGNLLMFAANDGVHGTQLWRSDGTAAGTFAVKNINNTVQLNAGIDTSVQTNAVNLGGVTYFMGTEQAHGNELWSTGRHGGRHASAEGHQPRFRQFQSRRADSAGHRNSSSPPPMDGVHGSELWVSDGSAAGTHMVADIKPGLPEAVRTSSA